MKTLLRPALLVLAAAAFPVVAATRALAQDDSDTPPAQAPEREPSIEWGAKSFSHNDGDKIIIERVPAAFWDTQKASQGSWASLSRKDQEQLILADKNSGESRQAMESYQDAKQILQQALDKARSQKGSQRQSTIQSALSGEQADIAAVNKSLMPTYGSDLAALRTQLQNMQGDAQAEQVGSAAARVTASNTMREAGSLGAMASGASAPGNGAQGTLNHIYNNAKPTPGPGPDVSNEMNQMFGQPAASVGSGAGAGKLAQGSDLADADQAKYSKQGSAPPPPDPGSGSSKLPLGAAGAAGVAGAAGLAYAVGRSKEGDDEAAPEAASAGLRMPAFEDEPLKDAVAAGPALQPASTGQATEFRNSTEWKELRKQSPETAKAFDSASDKDKLDFYHLDKDQRATALALLSDKTSLKDAVTVTRQAAALPAAAPASAAPTAAPNTQAAAAAAPDPNLAGLRDSGDQGAAALNDAKQQGFWKTLAKLRDPGQDSNQ